MSPASTESAIKPYGPFAIGSPRKPLCIDLFCGLGGWAEGFLAEGFECIGFDIERHDYGAGGYPGQLVLQDVLTLHGSQFRNAACIVASPPCQAYSYRAMPWKRAKALPPPSNALFEACFRIQREACETCRRCGHSRFSHDRQYGCSIDGCECERAECRYIPMVVENVKGAQPWVGRAKWRYGSYYLWGDVPTLMPITMRAVKVDGFNFHQHEKGLPGGSFQSAAVAAMDGTKHGGDWFSGYGGGFGWDHSQMRQHSSKSPARKAASAQIAKIPFELSRHIAAIYKP